MPLTTEQVREIAVEAARVAAKEVTAEVEKDLQAIVAEAVKQTLVQLGIESSSPIEMQKDFQHLRQWRTAGEKIQEKSLTALVGIFVAGALGMFGVGLKDWLSR